MQMTTQDLKAIRRTREGGNWATDRELLGELAESLAELGDVVYGSVLLDAVSGHVEAQLHDGRKFVAKVVFTSA